MVTEITLHNGILRSVKRHFLFLNNLIITSIDHFIIYWLNIYILQLLFLLSCINVFLYLAFINLIYVLVDLLKNG
jgi:hypothetical protein